MPELQDATAPAVLNRASINKDSLSLFSRTATRLSALWYIAICILLLRIVLVVFATRLQDYDGPRYLQEGINIVRYGTFSGETSVPPPPQAHDLPAYGFVLAGFIGIFKSIPVVVHVAAVLNALAFTFAAVELYGLVVLIGGNRRGAACAMILFGIAPELLPYSIFHMPDSLFLATFLGAVLLALQYLLEPKSSRLWLSFGLLGVSVLLRSVALYFAPIIVLAVCLRYWRTVRLWRPVATALLFGLLIEAAVLSPWVYRNYRVFGSPSFTSITGTNLFQCNYRFMLLDKGMSPGEVDALMSAQEQKAAAETPGYNSNPMVRADALKKIASSAILADPGAYIKTNLKRHSRMYSGTCSLELLDMLSSVPHAPDAPLAPVYKGHPARKPLQILLSIVLCALYALTICGAAVLVRKRRWMPLLAAGVPLLYFALVYGPVTGARYRGIMTPFFAVVAAFAVSEKKSSAEEPTT